MTHEAERAVRELEAGFEGEIANLFFMENIPRKKLNNAIKSYAQGFEAGETPVYLWDDTVFGSAKYGFLLTDRRIYQKNMFATPSSSELHGIVDFDLVQTKLYYRITPVGDSTLGAIEMGRGGGADLEAVAARLIRVIYALTGRTVGGEADEERERPGTFSDETPLECRSCGANLPVKGRVCEYCGGRFR